MSEPTPIGQLLHPLNDCVLVELEQKHKQFATREGRYDSRTEGIVIAIPEWLTKNTELLEDKNDIISDLLGKRIFFEEFKEGSRIERDGKLLSFIKIEDIRGWEDVNV